MVWMRRFAIIGSISTMLVNTGCRESPTPPDELPLAILSVSPDRGSLAGGTTVTITGVNFTNVTSVAIGGNELGNRTVVSATQITGTTPAAGSGGLSDVVVTAEHGADNCVGCFGYMSTLVDLVAGDHHTCALTNTAAAYCWGRNTQG